MRSHVFHLLGLATLIGPACALVLATASACGDDDANGAPSPVPSTDGGVLDANDAGTTHQDASGAGSEASSTAVPPPPSRPKATACTRPSPRPASNAISDGGADAAIECALDTDCTAKADGR